MKNLQISKSKSLICGLLVVTPMLMLSCAARRAEQAYGRSTQASYLYLEAGQSYTATVQEKWLSPQVLREKDQTILEQNRILERAGIQPYLPK